VRQAVLRQPLPGNGPETTEELCFLHGPLSNYCTESEELCFCFVVRAEMLLAGQVYSGDQLVEWSEVIVE
jgi:hypothetical protein